MAARAVHRSHELMQFEKQLNSMLNHFLDYERPENQRKALTYIPLDDLILIAQAKYDSCPKSKETDEIKPELVIRDMLLLELMEWFKNDFFKWMDSPLCPFCSQKTNQLGHGVPTLEETRKSASRVELYTCHSCFVDQREVARFARYNDPIILLETRVGRCGEWANCFALICRAVGFEVRHVTDQTDHVWVEIYSSGLKINRWLHADPCENKCDSPLLYERGWGKKLSYVIAVSQDDIQDVTWRYTSKEKQKDVLSRRNVCDEVWLVNTMMRLRKEKQSLLPEDRKKILLERLIYELVEFMTPKEDEKDSEKAGRESGSIAWRISRQELGGGSASNDADIITENYTWKITNSRIRENQFLLEYDCRFDKYSIVSNDGTRKYKDGWQNGAYKVDNVFRKDEKDWKMVYLARKEHANKQTAMISWKFALPLDSTTKQITSAKINIKSASFHPSARIVIKLSTSLGHTFQLSESNCVDGLWCWDSNKTVETNALVNGSKNVEIICELQGGDGDSAWQHMQLFRQKLPATPTLSTLNSSVADEAAPFSVNLTISED